MRDGFSYGSVRSMLIQWRKPIDILRQDRSAWSCEIDLAP